MGELTNSNYDMIISDIENYVAGVGGEYGEWHAGITEYPVQRLTQHNVAGNCLVREAESEILARRIEDYFHGLGMQGEGEDGYKKSVFVYAYKTNHQTVENIYI